MGKEKAPPIGRLQNSRIPSVGTAILQLAIVVFIIPGKNMPQNRCQRLPAGVIFVIYTFPSHLFPKINNVIEICIIRKK